MLFFNVSEHTVHNMVLMMYNVHTLGYTTRTVMHYSVRHVNKAECTPTYSFKTTHSIRMVFRLYYTENLIFFALHLIYL